MLPRLWNLSQTVRSADKVVRRNLLIFKIIFDDKDLRIIIMMSATLGQAVTTGRRTTNR